MKRLFKAIFSEDMISLKKIAQTIISEERPWTQQACQLP